MENFKFTFKVTRNFLFPCKLTEKGNVNSYEILPPCQGTGNCETSPRKDDVASESNHEWMQSSFWFSPRVCRCRWPPPTSVLIINDDVIKYLMSGSFITVADIRLLKDVILLHSLETLLRMTIFGKLMCLIILMSVCYSTAKMSSVVEVARRRRTDAARGAAMARLRRDRGQHPAWLKSLLNLQRKSFSRTKNKKLIQIKQTTSRQRLTDARWKLIYWRFSRLF